LAARISASFAAGFAGGFAADLEAGVTARAPGSGAFRTLRIEAVIVVLSGRCAALGRPQGGSVQPGT
jgi:hypothetical protein